MAICDYCGEEEGTKKITNPNMDELDEKPFWIVCTTCEEVIEVQKKAVFGQMLAGMNSEKGIDNKDRLDYANKIICESNDKLEEISKRTGKAILSAGMYRQPDGHYETVSIEFKGDDKHA